MGILSMLFGSGAKGAAEAVSEVAGIFGENREAAAARASAARTAALAQMAAEFQNARPSLWGQFVDGLNRLPRPMMAFGTIALFVYAIADPVNFAVMMQGLALIPEQLWWLMGAIVSFYFGAREMSKFRASRMASPEMVGNVVANIESLRGLDPEFDRETDHDSVRVAEDESPEAMLQSQTGSNAAVDEWRAGQ